MEQFTIGELVSFFFREGDLQKRLDFIEEHYKDKSPLKKDMLISYITKLYEIHNSWYTTRDKAQAILEEFNKEEI